MGATPNPIFAGESSDLAATRARLIQMRAIFEQALELSPAERTKFVHEACGGNEPLAAEIEKLLAAHESTRAFFERTGPELFSGLPSEGPDLAHHRIGPYIVEGEIGRGGMGIVYRAARVDGAFEKKVALKVVRLDTGSPEVIERFHRERQILARLDHPNIARILDGGQTKDGLPYIVMEFVDGEPIDSYSKRMDLSTKDRLRIFQDACAAVHYAHKNLIIHRDLKPSNILVTSAGVVKLLDFGIAKVLSEVDDNRTREQTLTIAVLMTPEYASPEQIAGKPVTTSTDVYSLGVVLFRLLTGASPYGPTDGWAELIRAICEEEAQKPSTVSSPNERAPKLDSELDQIVLMALRKEASRRYSSVEQFREDIQNYLTGNPIRAHRDSTAYRARKFVQRHRLGVSLGIFVAVCLILAVAAASWQAHKAIVEKKRADQESLATKAVSDFLQSDVLAQASPETQAGPGAEPDPDLKVRTALDRAATRIAGKFKDQPLLEASIRHTIGDTYSDLGLYTQAQQQVERAVALRRQLLGSADRNTLDSIELLGSVYHHLDKYAQAEPLLGEALRGRRRLFGADNRETLSTISNLASLYYYEGRYSEAEPLYAEVVEKGRRLLGDGNRETLEAMDALAQLYHREGRYAQAETQFLETLAKLQRFLGAAHPSTLATMDNLADLYRDEGKYAESVALLEKVTDVMRRVLGEQHPDTLIGLTNLALAYDDAGEYAKAEKLLTYVLETQRRVWGNERRETLFTMHDLAVLYREMGQFDRALELNKAVLALRRRVLGENHLDTLNSAQTLGRVYQFTGKYDQAASLFTHVLEQKRLILKKHDARLADVMTFLAEVRIEQKRYSEAEALLREAVTIYQETSPETWPRYWAESVLGASLAGQKRFAEAEPLLVAGYHGLSSLAKTLPVRRQGNVKQGKDRVIKLYDSWGKPDKAEQWRSKS